MHATIYVKLNSKKLTSAARKVHCVVPYGSFASYRTAALRRKMKTTEIF